MCQQVWLAVGGSVGGPKWRIAILKLNILFKVKVTTKIDQNLQVMVINTP